MMLLPRRCALLPLLLTLASCGSTPVGEVTMATTNPFPDQPVRIVEPFGAGGGPDLLARELAPRLSTLWGQPVIVENLTGGGATAAPARVAMSAADGYTLLLNTSAQAYTAALATPPSYDPITDFIPIIGLTTQPYVLVAGRHAGAATLADLISQAKARPGALRFASTGRGTGTHVGAVKFNRQAGIRCQDVPPQAAAGIAGVLAGTIDGRTNYMFAPISAVTLPRILEGSLVALGVSTQRRSRLLPETPTIAEAGVAGFDFPIWYGMWAPAGTPDEVIEKIARDVGRVMSDPTIGEWLAAHGAERMSLSRPQFATFVRDEARSAQALYEGAAQAP